MRVKNYQEELVLNTINLVLEDRKEINADELLIHDVAAYTLNRIPPKYIMSERGFTRLASEYWLDDGTETGLTSLVELVLLINRAIDVVSNRRKDKGARGELQAEPEESPDIEKIEYWHNFPQIIGKVEDSNTKKPIFGVCVTLYIDGIRAKPAEPGWQNPYHTNYGTKGFYSFWPNSIKSDDEDRDFQVRISYEHPDYKELTTETKLSTKGEFQLKNYIKVEDIFNTGTSYVEPK
jgi:competence protein ComFB